MKLMVPFNSVDQISIRNDVAFVITFLLKTFPTLAFEFDGFANSTEISKDPLHSFNLSLL